MAATLPVIKANTKPENITKMKFIAKQNKRSLAKELEFIIEKHIAEWEKEHGEITVDWMNKKEIIEDWKDRIQKKPPYGDKQ